MTPFYFQKVSKRFKNFDILLEQMKSKPKRRKKYFFKEKTIYIEIGWHWNKQMISLEIMGLHKYEDFGKTDFWYPIGDMIFSASRKELFKHARLAIAEYLNPEIKKVRERIGGEDNTINGMDGPTIDSLLKLQESLYEPMKPRVIYGLPD